MASKKDLFSTPPLMKELDIEKMLLNVANQEDLETLADINAFVKIVNKPKTKNLKSAEGVDIQSGDLGDPVLLKTDSGFYYSYHLAKKNSSAWVALSSSSLQSTQAMTREVDQLTIQAKTFRAVVEVVDFLIMQGWDKFHIEEGSPLMSWVCWAYLTHLEKKVTGYKPSDFDQVRLENSEDLFEGVKASIAQLVHEASNQATMGVSPGGVPNSEQQDAQQALSEPAAATSEDENMGEGTEEPVAEEDISIAAAHFLENQPDDKSEGSEGTDK